MLRKLLEKQKESLDYFFDTVDLSEIENAFQLLSTCKGMLVFSGVGKSGLVAQKIAATFVSTGTRALFLCPTNALHGDLGILSAEDIFIVLSKSGESQELLDLIPSVKKKGALLLAVVSHRGSNLEKAASAVIHLPVDCELCPFDLAPTTSTALQMMLGDLLAVALMHQKKFSMADFADNHPAGLLGRKITLRVADLMFKGSAVPVCRDTDKLIDQLHEFSTKQCGCLIITDENSQLQGIFTDGDLRRAIQLKGPRALESTLRELMTFSPKSISSEKLAIDAVQVMEEDPNRLITVLPVLEGAKVVGLIRMHDIIQAGLHRRAEPLKK
ncbi:MAG TPA: KpsF/GutQ family sugar-phosphate isomerase [Chlamydiales bacterium]|jgi:arabinose-5-phosphate isomerase|nr:KpsF/GutQ family sugar-phosphate isomerase [Chlamydiales bacterium]